MATIHTFSGNPMDRADALRRDEAAISEAAVSLDSRYLPLWNLNVLLEGVLLEGAEAPALGWLEQPEVARLAIDVPPVLLGIHSGRAHFAIDISALGDPMHELNLGADWQFDDARRAAMVLPVGESGILAQARSQLDWHRRHQFCSVCGQRSRPFKGGHVRRCPDCSAEHFPRTDPVAIMLIIQGETCLLGQSAGRLARTGMYSALAGFIDQGESIEEAVRREVMEEAGVEVGEVRYHSSQPWPFPSSLMIGCHGRAESDAISIDTEEMADVRWFSRTDVGNAMDGIDTASLRAPSLRAPSLRAPSLKVPGPIAIAHHLIKAWIDGEVSFS